MPTPTRATGATRAPAVAAERPGDGSTDAGSTDAGATVSPPAGTPGPAGRGVDEGTGRPARRRLPRPGRRVLAVAGLYLAVRAVGVAVLAWMGSRNGYDLSTLLTKWDGEWFLGLAGGGYDHVPAGLTDAYGLRDATTPLAFFPGYPALVAALAVLPGVGLFAAALSLNVVLGVVAALGVARLGALVTGSPRAGTVLVVLYAAAPMAVVLSMAYSETLFCALAVWTLVAVLERRWVLAGSLALLAGLVRPTAAPLVAVVVLAALLALVLRRRDGRRAGARALLGALLAPVGLLAYLGWVGYRTGSWNGWFSLQRRGWASGFDGGRATWGYTLDVLSHGRTVLEVVSVVLLVAGVVLVVVAVRTRVPWPVWLYGAGVVAMVVTSNGLMTSKARLLLPAFVLLVPVAAALARQSRAARWSVGVGVVLASSWFGAYTLAVYPFAI